MTHDEHILYPPKCVCVVMFEDDECIFPHEKDAIVLMQHHVAA
jgi:hypothetical protein